MASETAVFSRLVTWVAPAREADWDSLFAEQLPRIYNFLRYRVGNDTVAEDLTSATFEKAWQARHRYRRDLAAFSTWLFAIARNLVIDHYRRRRDQVPLGEAEHVEGGDDPAVLVERRLDAERLGRLMERLPDRERELIALKYGAGLTNRAIARIAGLTETNVGTLLHRTVARLRADWQEE